MTELTEHRDHITERLSADFANGTLDIDELERRLAHVQTASTSAELDALVTDLAPATTALVAVQRTRVRFGSLERRGPWTVPQRLYARVLCGNLELDLREARLAPGVTTIEIDITMGNVEIVAPPGLAIDVDASSFLGNVEDRVEHVAATTAASIRVVGRVRLGNLEVTTLHLGETRREARWRRRSERRWRRRQRRYAHWHRSWD